MPIGLVEIDRYDDDTLVKRKYIFDKYYRVLSKYEWAELPAYHTSNKFSSYHVFLLRVKRITEDQRDEIIKKIFSKDVSVNVHFRPVPSLMFYKNSGYIMNDYPVSSDNYSREITLPVYYDLTDEQLDTILNAVISSVDEVINFT